ncbi:unnamed protein product [Caenorhabditis bovis]|uniref:ZP domain-containing protein n=1 Tax=Caenorhabditis bovis TaxID=2654633 RepID=A0A8S1EV39_9PELO|nr:unnamed protein product [Caenorhabditis bovis]
MWLMAMLFFGACAAQQEDDGYQKNHVIGEPFVNCAADAIYVKFRTATTFHGHVDVKFTPNKSCFQTLVTNNQIEVLIPHEECMVPRQRSLQPSGLILESALSVSFHPEFTTSDDRIFNLKCFHQNRKNGTILAVGSPKPPPIDEDGPNCHYEVRDGPGGPLAGRLALGQSVYHSWRCENIKDVCMKVEKCELIGGEQKHEVIDEFGCSKDFNIMPQLEYHNKTHAGANVRVFGVSYTPIVYFSCRIRLEPLIGGSECPKLDCDSGNGVKRSRRDVDLTAIDVRSQNLEISQLVNSFDEKPIQCSQSDEIDNGRQVEAAQVEQGELQICANFQIVLISSITLTATCILLTTLVVVLIVRRQKYEIASMS